MKFLLALFLCQQSFAMYPSDSKPYPSDCVIECEGGDVKSSLVTVRFDLLRAKGIVHSLKAMNLPKDGSLVNVHWDDMREVCAYTLQGKTARIQYIGPLAYVKNNVVFLRNSSEIDGYLYYAQMHQKQLPLCQGLVVLQATGMPNDPVQQQQIQDKNKNDQENLLQCTPYFEEALEAKALFTKNSATFEKIQEANLETTNLNLNSISCIQGPVLSGFQHLKRLDISYTHFGDGTALKYFQHLKNLRTLFISNSHLDDLKNFVHLTQIERLTLNDNNISLQDITPIGSLTQLSSLGLFGLEGLETIESLAQLVNLTYLSIRRSNVDNLEPLSKHQHLQELDIRDTAVKDITPLLTCPSLVDLNSEGLLIDERRLSELNRHLQQNQQQMQQIKK